MYLVPMGSSNFLYTPRGLGFFYFDKGGRLENLKSAAQNSVYVEVYGTQFKKWGVGVVRIMRQKIKELGGIHKVILVLLT